MIVYLSTKDDFRAEVLSNRIEEKVHAEFQRVLGRKVGQSELSAWRHSLDHMDRVLDDAAIPSDSGVAIEFNIPQTGKRVDFILTGLRDDGQRVAVIIELKQWESAALTQKDAIVRTFIGGCDREVSHPSYQAWSYAMLVEDFNETVRLDPIHLRPCAYLHNCESGEVINSARYSHYTDLAPAFLRDDATRLREFIKAHVKKGDSGETMYRIRDGRIRPSKGLADHLASLLQGNREFYLIDGQKLVYETALHLTEVAQDGPKQVLIVNGGPGTGKSVVAINLLVELTQRERVVKYVTKNSAPRAVYESKLAGTMRKSRISNLFVGSGGFIDTEPDIFDALVVDEAHRLNEKSGLYCNQGENQVKELVASSRLAVFFLDENQRIHWKDIGRGEEIRKWANHSGAVVTEMALESQFRCNGSDGYLAWVDQALHIRETENRTLEGSNYEFKVCDSPSELRDLIFARNTENNKARMVAGYCWDWVTKKKDPKGFDIKIPQDGFAARWNLDKDGSLWIVSPNSVTEVGCIHTCQGLELDYVGVILGPDFVVRGGEVVTDAGKRSSMDSSIKGYKTMVREEPDRAQKLADEIIKNTYRTLMTRGSKGCYVYSTDPETNEYLKTMSVGALPVEIFADKPSPPTSGCPFPLLSPEEAGNRTDLVPVFDLKIAAGGFSKEQWSQDCHYAELPEYITPKPGFFVAQVVGESMNRRIPNGSWCLFREPSAGSREGKVVLVQSRDIQDPDMGGQFTVKIYRSEKLQQDDSWRHGRIHLSPDSLDPTFETRTLQPDAATDLRVVGEFVAIVG